MTHSISRVVSGGQTGVDRAALDAAIFVEIPHGGWCPKDRRSESGPIPDLYQLTETDSRNYAVRTEQNVIDSDGTLILFEDILSGGTELTSKLARKHKRPCLCLDLAGFVDWTEEDFNQAITTTTDWLATHSLNVLNIAGPRESSAPGIQTVAESFLVRLLQ